MSRTSLAVSLALAFLIPAVATAQPTVKREPARPTGAVEGVALYNAYCAVCHGKDGKGAGPAAPALKMPVPDLTTLATRNSGQYDAAAVEASITGKGRPMAAHGSEEMPIWGPIFQGMSHDAALTTLRIKNLVTYIEEMQQK